MNPGVYKIVNVSQNIGLGSISNAILPAPGGVLDSSGAVVIVLDKTDKGNLDVSSATLNGLDDLGAVGTRDPQGTHNFVLYGPDYQGNVTGDATDLTGIVYLPLSALTFNGNTNATFTGAVVVASVLAKGGGNGVQQFRWICGLSAVDNSHLIGGSLVR